MEVSLSVNVRLILEQGKFVEDFFSEMLTLRLYKIGHLFSCDIFYVKSFM